MRVKSPYFFLLPLSFMFWSVSMTAQSHKLPEPQANVVAMSDPAPPPGFPIDEHSYMLVFAGLGLGIYLLRLRKTA